MFHIDYNNLMKLRCNLLVYKQMIIYDDWRMRSAYRPHLPSACIAYEVPIHFVRCASSVLHKCSLGNVLSPFFLAQLFLFLFNIKSRRRHINVLLLFDQFYAWNGFVFMGCACIDEFFFSKCIKKYITQIHTSGEYDCN